MNEILKKRIEEAADRFGHLYPRVSVSDVITFRKDAFNAGADYALSHQWISIDEALPDCKINVIGRCRDGRIYVMRRCDYGPFYNWDVPTDIPPNYLALDSKDVTHWMPIPEMEE